MRRGRSTAHPEAARLQVEMVAMDRVVVGAEHAVEEAARAPARIAQQQGGGRHRHHGRIVVGLGGSSCTDGGRGMVDELGGLVAARKLLGGVELIADGRPVPVLLGVAVILVPLVALAAMLPLVRLARDGARMMAQANASGAHGDWARELERAEECRVARDRKGEQAHYLAAVRAWRAERG